MLYTDDVREWRAAFDLTHAVAGGFGWACWQLARLPMAGGVDEQPAKLMEAIRYIAAEENARLMPAPATDDTAPGEAPRRRRRARRP